MKKYEGYENTEAFTGDFETLSAGGYICKILQVKTEEKSYGELLRIGFDIAEGEHKDFYKRQFDKAKTNNPDAKWRGMYYQTVKKDDLKFFKGFISAIESSNSGFKWDWDEKKLVGKLFGGIFSEEEYYSTSGEVKVSVKCSQVRSADKVRTGDFKLPDRKKVSEAAETNTNGYGSDSDLESELPF